jgi:hypothetical protein
MADLTHGQDYYRYGGDGAQQDEQHHWTQQCVNDAFGKPSLQCSPTDNAARPAQPSDRAQSGCVFPDSSSRALSSQDLEGKSQKELWYGRNEIYARHGYNFQSKELNDHFQQQSWYKPDPDFKDSDLNQTERDNIAAIRNQEAGIKQKGNPADSVPKSDNSYLLADPNKQLTDADLSGLSADQLRMARNEIFARHGYPFQSADLQQYFGKESWYKANPNYTDDLSQTEHSNVKLLLDREAGLRREGTP